MLKILNKEKDRNDIFIEEQGWCKTRIEENPLTIRGDDDRKRGKHEVGRIWLNLCVRHDR